MAERPHIDSDKCTGCGTGIDVCPIGVFEMNGDKSVVKKPDDCIQCKACEVSCPAKAIIVK